MDKAEVAALQEYEDAMELGNEATPASKTSVPYGTASAFAARPIQW